MKKRLIKAIKDEKGQALPIVLILLVLGGLLVAPCLSYAATGLNSGRVIEKNVNALYAADAGIENALWKLKNSPPGSYPYSYTLPQTVNGLSVAVLMERVTTLWGIVVGAPGNHADWMEVDGGMVYDDQLDVYIYTVTITNKHVSNIKLDQILVKLPENFEYISGSTGGNFTTEDPDPKGNPDSGITLVWDFQPPYPTVEGAPDPEHGIYNTETQTFQLSGPAEPPEGDDYVWVVAQRSDISCVGEANAYKITAQAKKGETVVMTVEAGALKDNQTSEVLVSCWEINP